MNSHTCRLAYLFFSRIIYNISDDYTLFSLMANGLPLAGRVFWSHIGELSLCFMTLGRRSLPRPVMTNSIVKICSQKLFLNCTLVIANQRGISIKRVNLWVCFFRSKVNKVYEIDIKIYYCGQGWERICFYVTYFIVLYFLHLFFNILPQYLFWCTVQWLR